MAEASQRYDFDAPTHVADFMELVNAETDDKWFDQRTEGADPHLVTPAKPQQGENVSTTSSNIITSWGGEPQGVGRPKRTADKNPAQPRRVSKRKEMDSNPIPLPSKKQKEDPVPLSSQSSFRRSKRLKPKVALKTREVHSSSKNTEPNSSEQLELERIRNLQKEVALHRRRNEASLRAALAGGPPPKKAVLSTTVPKDFHFHTDSRIKASTSSDAPCKETDFVQQLRKPSSPVKARKGATVPKPFSFSVGHNKKEEEPEDYVPMAQRIEQFQNRTPTRYHRPSRRDQERGPSPVKGPHLKLTQPQSPCLKTRQRSRPAALKSSSELEAEELEQLQKCKIKALELNRKILEGAEELKKPAVKGPTVPQGFELEIEKRLQDRHVSKKPQEVEEKPHSFRANPLPLKVLEGVVGLPEKKVPLPTVPESPAFALKRRIRPERKVEEVLPPPPVKVQPVPHFGLTFQPRLPEDHQIEVCPFSFEQREKERRALKEKKLEELRNEEVPQFKAQLLPDFSTVVLPEKKKLDPTKPEPFKLLIDERGALKNSRWEEMVQKEQKLLEEAAVFKARSNTVTHKEPFRPQKESRQTLDINSSAVVEPFELATERRAKEWQEYEQQNAEKKALRAQMEEHQRQEEEQREKEEITRLRQEQVHKAQPIRQYRPVVVKKSERPLTVPESPNFSERFRL
ncbi:targeting protein for Xklp2-B [Nematolebias whitei]|uniref:targeting protein for Xklp2-B n=1 Tax=Nematolebias whitei TaxID=451745 RepID=UPI00189B989E|nr:targeting protein for Xklp2-B [Nematolebias whitei]